MDWLLDLVSSSGVGTIVGGIFGWLGKREERENMKMKFDHDENMLKAKTNHMVEVAKMGIETAKIAGELAVDELEAKGFAASQIGSKWANNIKAMIRPIILGLLMYQTYLIIESLEQLSGGLTTFSEEEIASLYRIVILAVTGLTSTAVGWYFAARSSKQFDKLLDKWHK